MIRPTARALAWRLYARRLAQSKRPILIGPWRSEVGFEVLYWMPFLNALRQRYHIDRDRLIAIGRGGSAAWYDTAGQADLYEYLPIEAARTLSIQHSKQTGSLKQNSTPAWERHVAALVATSLGIRQYHILSPSWMYQLCRPYWEGQQTLAWLDRYCLHAITTPAPAMPADLRAKLPSSYVAMRWYIRPTWPHTEKQVLWMRQTVEAVAKTIPVVLIDSGVVRADDHADIHLGPLPNVLRLRDLTEQTPLTNLAIQSAVIARAKAYVGTYGGMAQGAMRWGVPTVALYDQFGQTSPAHLHLTHALSLQTRVPFVVTHPQGLDTILGLVQSVTKGGLQLVPHPSTPELEETIA